jgi:hypothetical protein
LRRRRRPAVKSRGMGQRRPSRVPWEAGPSGPLPQAARRLSRVSGLPSLCGAPPLYTASNSGR